MGNDLRLGHKTLEALARLICGDDKPWYRKGYELPEFFRDAGLVCSDHDGSWRYGWTLSKLEEYNQESAQMLKILEYLANPKEYPGNPEGLNEVIASLNSIILVEGLQVALDGRLPIVTRLEGRSGVRNSVKNLIFAAKGLKPEIVLSDAVSNDIQIVQNADKCLVYDRPIPPTGLTWGDLVNWWAGQENSNPPPDPTFSLERRLYNRLYQSLDSEVEQLLFKTYYRIFPPKMGERLPVLIPQVYLHYDPYTMRYLNQHRRLPRQRMDFLLLFSDHARVVIEVDGKQHYSDNNGTASPQLYADMVRADRQLRLAGYEIYRFGGYEFQDSDAGKTLVEEFFRQLLLKHDIPTEDTR